MITQHIKIAEIHFDGITSIWLILQIRHLFITLNFQLFCHIWNFKKKQKIGLVDFLSVRSKFKIMSIYIKECNIHLIKQVKF